MLILNIRHFLDDISMNKYLYVYLCHTLMYAILIGMQL